MNSQNIKKFVFILLTILLIILIMIIVIYLKNRENNNKNYTENGDDILSDYGKTLNGGIDYQSYFDVKACMQKYLNAININNLEYGYFDEQGNHVATLEDDKIKQKIYNLLSDKYISDRKINLGNLYDYIKTFKKETTFLPLEATLIQDGNIKSFLVYGLIQSAENYEIIDKIYSIVNINVIDAKFSIELIEGDYNSISDINIELFEETIKENEDNRFKMSYIKPEEIPAEYIAIYKGLAIYAPEKLYNLLDENYKNAKFGSFDEFKKYISKNKSQITRALLDKYKIDIYEDYNRYICIDKNKNYYVINQKEILEDYTMLLDTYTIDLPEFIEKYESSADNIKVALNIEKLVEASKMGDYRYIYNKLDESFRLNNFKSLNEFEKFMQGKFDAREDTIKYDKYQKVTGVHVYNIVVTDKNENKTINAKVVMDLKENRDFVFSFSVEN